MSTEKGKRSASMIALLAGIASLGAFSMLDNRIANNGRHHPKHKRTKTWKTYAGFLAQHNRINNEYELKSGKKRMFKALMIAEFDAPLKNRSKVWFRKLLRRQDKAESRKLNAKV